MKGREGVCGKLGRGGAKYFFSGAKFPPRIANDQVETARFGNSQVQMFADMSTDGLADLSVSKNRQGMTDKESGGSLNGTDLFTVAFPVEILQGEFKGTN